MITPDLLDDVAGILIFTAKELDYQQAFHEVEFLESSWYSTGGKGANTYLKFKLKDKKLGDILTIKSYCTRHLFEEKKTYKIQSEYLIKEYNFIMYKKSFRTDKVTLFCENHIEVTE